MQTESVLQTKNRSEPARNRFSVALHIIIKDEIWVEADLEWCDHI